MGEYPEEAALDDALRAAIQEDTPGGVVVGWAVCVAYRDPEDSDTHLVYYAPGGQPGYATVGLLTQVLDWLRTSGWRDGG